jgi:deoxyribose-phosphate aldolase
MSEWSVKSVAATIDHAVLKAEFGQADLASHAALCRELGVFSMCVKPCDVSRAVALLAGSEVKVSCVLSFPHGADTPATKVFQAQQAIEAGVDEIDMVMNVGRFLSGEYEAVEADIRGVAVVCRAHQVLLKVILESCYLSLEQVAAACRICERAGADFVKTSTGFGSGSATPKAVDVMVKTVGGRLGVKASGGIRRWEDAVMYLDMGATRLGIGASADVLSGGCSDSEY